MSIEDTVKVVFDAQVHMAVATAQLGRFSLHGPADSIRRAPASYRLDLSLTPRPRNASACFLDRWRPQHFKRIGRMFVLPPQETVQTKSDVVECEQRSVICYLRPEPMREWFDGDLVWTDRSLEAALDLQNPAIRNHMLRLAAELRSPGFATQVLVGLIASEIAVELARYCTSVKEGPVRGGLAPWRLRLIDERLNEISSLPTLPELAQLCGLSVRALTRGFRESRGLSIGDHVANRRLEHARKLLAAGESTKKTAYALGFASSPAFCYAFRRGTGETPSDFHARTLAQDADTTY